MYKVMAMETAKDGLLVLTKDKQNVGIRNTMKILTNVAQPECRQQLVSERKLYNRKCAGHYMLQGLTDILFVGRMRKRDGA